MEAGCKEEMGRWPPSPPRGRVPEAPCTSRAAPLEDSESAQPHQEVSELGQTNACKRTFSSIQEEPGGDVCRWRRLPLTAEVKQEEPHLQSWVLQGQAPTRGREDGYQHPRDTAPPLLDPPWGMS